MDAPYREGRFPTTHWSLVGRAGRDADQDRRQALGELLVRYLPALRAHLVYGKHLSPDDADDLLQEFVAGKILEKNLIGRADAHLGKFRTFLLTSLDRFRIDRVREQAAQKRSPGEGRQQILGDQADLLKAPQSCDAFDVAWARNVIEQTVAAMRQQCEASGRMDVWGVFECRLLDPLMNGAEPVEYEAMIERFGFQSPSQASNVLVTAKRMFARLLRSVIGEYALGTEEIESEIRDLMEVLAAGGSTTANATT
jgi:DNA-directed RNA polymerase specialized sigma24 family protein